VIGPNSVVTQSASALWLVLASLTGFFMLRKLIEILHAITWVRKHGKHFADRVKASLETGSANITEIERDFPVHQKVWHSARTWSKPLKFLVNYVYRIPSLIIIEILLVLWAHSSNLRIPFMLWLSIALVVIAIVVTFLNTFFQKISYGWFDAYKRDWRTNPLNDYTLHAAEVNTRAKASKTILFFLSLCYLTIIGFSAVYYALYTIDSGSFEGISTMYVVYFQLLYFTTVTMATVGYGEIHPLTDIARMLVVLQIVFGPVLLALIIPTLMGPDDDGPERNV
jgi:hypothetical protein